MAICLAFKRNEWRTLMSGDFAGLVFKWPASDLGFAPPLTYSNRHPGYPDPSASCEK